MNFSCGQIRNNISLWTTKQLKTYTLKKDEMKKSVLHVLIENHDKEK